MLTPPIRGQFFDGEVELPSERGGAPVRLPVKFKKTTDFWAQWCQNVVAAIEAIVIPTTTIVFPGQIKGLVPSNSTVDATNDIVVSAGRAAATDDSTLLILSASMTKRLDGAWVQGSDAGGMLGTAALVASTTLHAFLIGNGTDVDVGFDSSTTPTLPSGWTAYRRIFSIFTTSTPSVPLFSAREMAGGALQVIYLTRIADQVAVALANSARQLFALSVPSGVVVDAMISARLIPVATTVPAVITSPDETDAAPVLDSNADFAVAGTAFISQMVRRTNTSRQVGGRQAATGDSTLTVLTLGYTDQRV